MITAAIMVQPRYQLKSWSALSFLSLATMNEYSRGNWFTDIVTGEMRRGLILTYPVLFHFITFRAQMEGEKDEIRDHKNLAQTKSAKYFGKTKFGFNNPAWRY
jgi:hypothetical protein